MDRQRKFVGSLGTILCAMVFVLGGPSVGLASPTLQFTGSILTGVTGVDVGGTLYDVQFMDGTCVALFNGCDQNSDFIFSTVTGAHEASVALINALASFQTPEDVAGCNYEYLCSLNTPYGDFFLSSGQSYVKTWQASLSSSCCSHFDVPSNGIPVNFDMHYDSEDTITWALWAAASPTAPAPEPSSFLLLVNGLVGIAGYSWRRRCRAGAKPGPKRAIVAVAHSLLRAVYVVLETGNPYTEYAPLPISEIGRTRKTRQLCAQSRNMGFEVTLHPKPQTP